jgi:hypothetical protein
MNEPPTIQAKFDKYMLVKRTIHEKLKEVSEKYKLPYEEVCKAAEEMLVKR